MITLFIVSAIAFYICGMILAYGRAYAHFRSRIFAAVWAPGSWIGVIVGCLKYEGGPWFQWRD